LDIQNINIEKFPGIFNFLQIFNKNEIITCLDLSSSKMGDDAAICLAKELELNKNTKFKNLTQLIFRNCEIGDEGARALAQAIEKNGELFQQLKLVDFSQNQISTSGEWELIIRLAYNKNSKLDKSKLKGIKDINYDFFDENIDLSLSDNDNRNLHILCLNAEYIKILEPVLKNIQFNELYFSATQSTSTSPSKDYGSKLIESLNSRKETFKNLVKLDLSNSFGTFGVYSEIIKVLGKFLTSSSIKLLNLAQNNIQDFHAETLAKILENNESLTEVNLSKNSLKDAGVGALLKVVKNNKVLKKLNLAENGITELGSDNLAKVLFEESLKKNSYLEELDLSYNEIRDMNSWKNYSQVSLRLNLSKNEILEKYEDVELSHSF